MPQQIKLMLFITNEFNLYKLRFVCARCSVVMEAIILRSRYLNVLTIGIFYFRFLWIAARMRPIVVS